MGVITISRQVGSQGTLIAQSVADELGFVVIDKEDIEAIMDEYGFVSFELIYDAKISFWGRFDEQRTKTVEFLRDVMCAIAKHGDVVLLGRGGFGLLQGYTDVLNVRIKAPLELRAIRKQEEHGGSDRTAKESLERIDRIRSSFVSHDLGYDMNDIDCFDLVLDTGVVSTSEASATIVGAYRHLLSNHRTNARKTRADLSVDEVLERLVAKIIGDKRKET